ncbi:uncharacterized protein LOC112897547 [Panicum hallii]|uniref:uncharacterized protein LOC112897547 n=1 Tax=Panicum hallii TaxID=206008 RepID=UPI000DF4DC1E|nr:uncharacterized protein LOC112897547 [Panicum hallii]
MDGGSSLNILYVETLDAMDISQSKLCTSVFLFLGIVPGMRAYPLGNIELPITFGDRNNFCTETLIFEFKLKMLGPNGIITVNGSFKQAYACGREHFELATAIANSAEL